MHGAGRDETDEGCGSQEGWDRRELEHGGEEYDSEDEGNDQRCSSMG